MSPELEINTLLLDLDGTLAESLPGIEHSVRAALAACGLEPLGSDFGALVGPPIRAILRTISGCEGADLDALERAFRDSYDREGWQKTRSFPGVVETLAVLSGRGIRSFVVTNKPRIPTERILTHLGVAHYVTAIYTPDTRQPPFGSKAEAVIALLRDWNIPCAGALMVGDSLDDAHAGRMGLCRFAGVQFGYGNACSQAEYPVHFTLQTFGDLIPLIDGQCSASSIPENH